MSRIYTVYNGPMPTTAALVGVTTGTVLKTMLQLKLGASTNQPAKIKQWGISFAGSAAAVPIRCELLTTGSVGATITEFVAADIIPNDPNVAAVTDDFPLAFTAAGDESGYTASVEGSITATRPFDIAYVPPTDKYVIQFPLGDEPEWKQSEFLRIRVHNSGTAVDCICYIKFEI